MSDERRAVLVRVEGCVQGVGYRAFTQSEAERLDIKGWVVNRADGSVEAALHGGGLSLASLISRLRQGPPGAKVDNLDVRSTDQGQVVEVPDDSYGF